MQFCSTNAQIKCAKKIKISACQSKFTYYIVWAALTVCQHLLATWQSWNAATMMYRNLKYVHHQTVLYVFGFQGCWSIPNTKFSFLFFCFGIILSYVIDIKEKETKTKQCNFMRRMKEHLFNGNLLLSLYTQGMFSKSGLSMDVSMLNT